jgi:hypothetical protein
MILEDVRGLITTEVGDALRALAAAVPADQAIVELGSFKGMSTAYLATGARDGHGAPVFAVDPWDLPGNPYGKHGYSAPIVREEFERQLRGLRLWSRVTPLRAFSTQAAAEWDGPKVGLLFVDADHSEKAVRADIAAWQPHLAVGHVIACDDLDTPRNPGVRVVVEELVAAGYQLEVRAERLAVLC